MPTITHVATALPPHELPLEAVKAAFQQHIPLDERRMAAVLRIFDNAQVAQRYSAVPIEHLALQRPLDQTSEEYRLHAIALGRQAVSACLEQSGVRADEIDILITVSCTGLIIPSLDAYLINDLGFRSNTRRLPITELGCAAGAAALARAYDLLRSSPEARALVVAVELPTLTLQHGDLSQANMVSMALFGDGAAAALLTGWRSSGAEIIDTESYLFPNSIDAMGFDLKENGLHIVLAKHVPELVRGDLPKVLPALLMRNDVTLEQLSFMVLHPGGRKILSSLEEDLGLTREDTQLSWDVLRDYGNLSSASVLFVLRELMERRRPEDGDYGLMAAFGPGFSAELLLLRWAEALQERSAGRS